MPSRWSARDLGGAAMMWICIGINVYAVQHGLLMCACNKMLSAVPGQLCAPCLMAVQHHQATPATLQELFRQVSKSV